jgi:hypothetical protein
LKDSLIGDLQAMLHHENSYVSALITSHEILSEEYKIVIKTQIDVQLESIQEYSTILIAMKLLF